MNKRDRRIAHFGYSSNLGGVEMFIKNVSDYSDFGIDIVVSTNEAIPYEESLLKNGSRVFRITSRRNSPLKYALDILRILRSNQEIRIVHWNVNTLSSIMPLFMGRICGKKCVVHSHSSNTHYGKMTRFLHFLNRHIYSLFTDCRLACSNDAGVYMFGDKSYQIINNGIDVNRFCFSAESRKKVRNEFGFNNNDFVLCHVGNYSKIKNQSFLIDVFYNLLKVEPNSKLVLVGDGGDRPALERKIKELNICDKVFLTGKRMDVPDILSASDCFVFPSLWEGLPFTLVEAQTNGIPILCSDNVPKESCLTDLIKYLSLDAPISEWVDIISSYISVKSNNRSEYCERMLELGWNVSDTVKKLDIVYERLIND